eukprot:TRINITY_DN2498_c0_g1_i1.p1 TRINITY_DN2498_c0_g1~~TRINITY_DN2498_c0_g1_i1.p1  ORF type:complete len:111 (+),score=3.79 TRINITY_DN2498_c0_g1_i1:101-433(+)
MYCYRFPDRDTFVASCEALGWASEGVVTHYTHDRAIDEIGPIQTLPGTYDEDGVELTPPVFSIERHINFQGTPPVEWDLLLIDVNSPNRTFAGSPGPSTTAQELNELRTT